MKSNTNRSADIVERWHGMMIECYGTLHGLTPYQRRSMTLLVFCILQELDATSATATITTAADVPSESDDVPEEQVAQSRIEPSAYQRKN